LNFELEDIKAYIETGILELYVLGDVSPAEKLQVEEMAAKHPAIKAELDEIERSMELYAQKNAVEPSEQLRSKILESIIPGAAKSEEAAANSVAPKDNIISMPSPNIFRFYKYAFAACLALLLVSIVALVSLYHKLQDSNTQIASLQLDKQRFANTVSLKDGELQVLQDASFKFLKLQGTVHAPAALVTVAWSPVRKKVWIDMHSIKMPENDKDHQYQLWALVAGKPVDLGVFDANPDSTDMKEMKSIASADAFAVTLEPRGGSASPTMDEMMVLGKF